VRKGRHHEDHLDIRGRLGRGLEGSERNRGRRPHDGHTGCLEQQRLPAPGAALPARSRLVQARLVVREPAVRVDFRLSVDNKLIGENTVFYSRDRKLGEVPHQYDFLITEKGNHSGVSGAPARGVRQQPRDPVVCARRHEQRTDEVGWSASGPAGCCWTSGAGSPADLRAHPPVDIDYYRSKVIGESAKWGANLVHYWNWTARR